MGKVIKGVAKIFIPILGGPKAMLGAALTAVGVMTGNFALISSGVSMSLSTLKKNSGGGSATNLDRLQARLDTQAPRKMVLGTTAMPADIRYYEGSGTDEEYIDYILVVAAHRVRSIDEIWFEDQLAWKTAGGVQGEYVGYLKTVTTRLEGTAANTVAINGGTRWGSDDRLTGCAYVHLRIKRSGNKDDEQSPLASGLPGRVTIIGEGMPMYDPRYDSTMGGSGPMRIADQSTWGASSENPIIQSLNVLLGWRINGKLSVGAGLPVKYLGIASAITAANICDENIALSTGGSQPRYRTAGAFSTDDAPMNIVSALLAGCAGDLLDSDGQLSFLIKTNTLATPAVVFDDHDIVSGARWDPMGGETDLPNIITGSFTDPSPKSLYQMVPYPSVKLPSEDGIERTAPLDLAVVENSPQAQRLVKQTLQRKQYPGTFSAEYNLKGMAAKVGSIVWQSYSPRGWVNKPFRVVRQKPSRSGRIALVLREEHASIYSWAAEDSAAVKPAEPVGFDPKNAAPIMLARKAAETADWPKVKDSEGTKPEDNATVGAPSGTPVGDKTADEVVDTIDQHSADWIVQDARNIDVDAEISEARQDIADLFETYGFTASAADSAAIAKQVEDIVLQAKGEVEGYVGEVEEDRLAVEDARGDALQYRNAAVAARDGAQGFEAGAATQAGLSVTARNAAEAANAASAKRLADQLPKRIPDAIGTGFYTTNLDGGHGYPNMAPTDGARPQTFDKPNFGWVWKPTTLTKLGHTSKFPMLPGRVYALSVAGEIKGYTGSGHNLVSFLFAYNKTVTGGTYGTVGSAGFTKVFTGNGRFEIPRLLISKDVDLPGVTLAPDGELLGMFLRYNGPANMLELEIADVEDVTGQFKADASATASAQNATFAEASNNEAEGFAASAGQQASLAVEAKNTATSKADIATAQAVIATEKAAQASQNTSLTVQYRDATLGFRNETEGFKNTASSKADIAAAQAVIATDKAAAATASASVAANVGQRSINPNPGFDDFPSPAVGAAPSRYTYTVIGTGDGYRVNDPQGGFAWRLPAAANAEVLAGQDLRSSKLIKGGDWVVAECEVTLNAGSLSGAGLLFRETTGTSTSRDNAIDLFAEIGAGAVGQTYRVTKIFKTVASTNGFALFVCSHWNGFGKSIASANDVTFLKALIRPATQAEIDTKTVLPDLQASVTINQAAIAGLENTAAIYEILVAASNGNPAAVRLLSGKNGSAIDLVSDVVRIRNSIDGSLVDVATFENGIARINTALINESFIRDLRVAPIPQSEIFLKVMLEPIILLGSDGQTLQYRGGASFGANPAIVPDTSGLPALAQGEKYEAKATQVTGSQFVASVKKLTAGAITDVTSNAGAAASGTPLWRTNKPVVADAYNGYYQYSFSVRLPQLSVQTDGGGQYQATYGAAVDIYGLVGSTWTKIGTANLTHAAAYASVPPQTVTRQHVETVQSSLAFGSGSNRFGLHALGGATITAFDNVKFSTQANSNAVPVAGSIPWEIRPPTGT